MVYPNVAPNNAIFNVGSNQSQQLAINAPVLSAYTFIVSAISITIIY
jgi:hypothetical protein